MRKSDNERLRRLEARCLRSDHVSVLVLRRGERIKEALNRIGQPNAVTIGLVVPETLPQALWEEVAAKQQTALAAQERIWAELNFPRRPK